MAWVGLAVGRDRALGVRVSWSRPSTKPRRARVDSRRPAVCRLESACLLKRAVPALHPLVPLHRCCAAPPCCPPHVHATRASLPQHFARALLRHNWTPAACPAPDRRHLARPSSSAPAAASCHHELVLRPPQVGRCECPRAALPANAHGSARRPLLTSLQAPASPAAGHPVAKKDPNAPEPTPLEKLLANAGPLRGDGSDKFFGFENVSAPADAASGNCAC